MLYTSDPVHLLGADRKNHTSCMSTTLIFGEGCLNHRHPNTKLSVFKNSKNNTPHTNYIVGLKASDITPSITTFHDISCDISITSSWFVFSPSFQKETSLPQKNTPQNLTQNPPSAYRSLEARSQSIPWRRVSRKRSFRKNLTRGALCGSSCRCGPSAGNRKKALREWL